MAMHGEVAEALGTNIEFIEARISFMNCYCQINELVPQRLKNKMEEYMILDLTTGALLKYVLFVKSVYLKYWGQSESLSKTLYVETLYTLACNIAYTCMKGPC